MRTTRISIFSREYQLIFSWWGLNLAPAQLVLNLFSPILSWILNFRFNYFFLFCFLFYKIVRLFVNTTSTVYLLEGRVVMWVSFQIDLWLFSTSHKNKPQQVPFNFWSDRHSRGLLPIFVRIYSVTSYRDPPHFIIKSRTIALIGMPRAHRKISVIFHPDMKFSSNCRRMELIQRLCG